MKINVYKNQREIEKTYEIGKKKLTVIPEANKSKVYGDADFEIQYTTSGAVEDEIPAFTGSLTREAGENVGSYAVLLGTLALTAM